MPEAKAMKDYVLPVLHWPRGPWPGMDADMEATPLDATWVKLGMRNNPEFDEFVEKTYALLQSPSSAEEEEEDEEPEFKGKGKGKGKGKPRVKRSKKVNDVGVSDEEGQSNIAEMVEGKGKGKVRVKKSRGEVGREDEGKTKGKGKGKKGKGTGRSKPRPKSKELVEDDDDDDDEEEGAKDRKKEDGETIKLPGAMEEAKTKSGEAVEGEVGMEVEATEEELELGQVDDGLGGKNGSGEDGSREDGAVKRKRGASVGSTEPKRPKTGLEPLPSRSTFKLPNRPAVGSCKQCITFVFPNYEF